MEKTWRWFGRKEDVGNKIAEDICAAGGSCEFMKTDVMNAEVVKKNCEDLNLTGTVAVVDGGFNVFAM